jgi:ABC-type branched-subunit amino acid transport system permease subunit
MIAGIDPGLYASTLIDGAITGSIFALLAMGIVAVYRTTRTLNLAQGGMATMGAYLFITLREHSVPTLLALPVVVAVGAAVGLGVGQLIGWPLRRASATVKLVASLGILLVVQSVSAMSFGVQSRPSPPLVSRHIIDVAGVTVVTDGLVVLVIAAAVALLLNRLFVRTRLGLQMRAVAVDPIAAALQGIDVRFVTVASWTVGAVLAFGAGALLGPILVDVQPYLLTLIALQALSATLVGRLDSLTGALIGGLIVGEVVTFSQFWFPQTSGNNSIALFGFVLLLLLIQRRGALVGGVVTAVRRSLRWSRPLSLGLLILGLFAPAIFGKGDLVSVTASLVFAIAALSVVIVTGWAGQTSLAQVTFMGVGAVTYARLTVDAGLPMYFAIPLAVLAAAVLSVVIGLPALRLRGIYLAIATLAFAEVIQDAVISNNSLSGSANGFFVARPVLGPLDLTPDRTLYYFLLGMLVACCLFVAWLRRTSFGRQLMALSDTEVGAAARGINLTVAKLAAFGVSAALAGLAGCLYVMVVTSVAPASFNPLQSIFLLGAVVLLGQESVVAAVAAGVLYAYVPTFLVEHLTNVFGDRAAQLPNLLVGVGLLALLVGREYLPEIAERLPRLPRNLLSHGGGATEALGDATA